jgi:hypothetical protein
MTNEERTLPFPTSAMNPFKRALSYHKARDAWLGSNLEPVSTELAQSRANICSVCPLNTSARPIWELITTLATSELRLQLEIKHHLHLSVENEDQLHVCDACDCHLPTKIWQPIHIIKEHTDLDTLHYNCWIRKELST